MMRPLLLALPLLVSTHLCAGGQLYRWIDDQGLVHFSDRLPANPGVAVQVQPLAPSATPALQPTDDPYSVMNQVQRLESERQQREAAWRAERLMRLEEARHLAEIEEARARARLADSEAERARQSLPLDPGFPPDPQDRPDRRCHIPPGANHWPDTHCRRPPGLRYPPSPSAHQRPGQTALRPARTDGRSLTTPGRSLPPEPSSHSDSRP